MTAAADGDGMTEPHSDEGPEDYRETLAAGFRAVLFPALPRILSQLNRDRDSPTFGCFDRNYWHYKIRDFPSAILQQGMLVLDALSRYDHEDNPLRERPIVREWIDGAMHFWAGQQLRSGAFNEYYPYEEGYPPTAFSLNAVTLVFRNRGFPTPEGPIRAAIQRACNWLLEHPEREALNQEAAGLAALALAGVADHEIGQGDDAFAPAPGKDLSAHHGADGAPGEDGAPIGRQIHRVASVVPRIIVA